MSTLETRIEKLERKLHEVQQRKSSVISMTEDIQEQSKTQTATDQAMQSTTTRAERRREVREIDDLVSDFGYL